MIQTFTDLLVIMQLLKGTRLNDGGIGKRTLKAATDFTQILNEWVGSFTQSTQSNFAKGAKGSLHRKMGGI